MLPDGLRKYINFVENQTNLPIAILSYGPDREETFNFKTLVI